MPGEAQRPRPKWVMVERGRRWQYRSGSKILALAHWVFNGWDGYLVTGEKFPNHQKYVPSARGDRRLCTVRRYVEYAIEDMQPAPSGAEKESQ